MAMILGMLPSAFGRGEGGEFRAPMSIATIGGLITSTLLTLVLVPVAYLLLDRLTRAGQGVAPARHAGHRQGRARDRRFSSSSALLGGGIRGESRLRGAAGGTSRRARPGRTRRWC